MLDKANNHEDIMLYLSKKPTKEELEFLDKINRIMRKCGCFVHFYDSSKIRTMSKDESFICLSINKELAHNSRGAGRRKKYVGRIKVGDVRKMMETKSADEVAAELGVSRSTFFRRIKGKDDNRYF